MNTIDMKKYTLSFFSDAYDNEVKEVGQFSWEEMCDLFSVHEITEHKNQLGFVAAKFKTVDYAPATRKLFKWVNGVEVENGREIKFDQTGNTTPGRLAENVVEYDCLVFDYDGAGVSLCDKIEEFKDFQHLGYTSHNHIIKGVDKFRIIFPFETPCPIHEWARREDAFREFGGVDDRSTTAKSRIFFTPSCAASSEQHKVVWNIPGAMLDWRVFAPRPIVIHQPRPLAEFQKLSAEGRGPYAYDSLDIVSFFKAQGRYVRPNANGKHEVTCFRANEHNTNSAGGVVIYEGGGGKWPSFYCGHSHSLGSKDFWKFYKELDNLASVQQYCLREDTAASGGIFQSNGLTRHMI